MKQTTLTVTENTRLADGIYRLRLAGDTSAITAPGQFVNLKLSGFFLRRPISVCDWSDGELTLIYKVLGHGTEAMTGMAPGTELDVLTGLGNGFDVSRGGEHPLLVGGGVGIPPLYGLAKRLTAQGRRVTAVLGFNRKSEIFLAEPMLKAVYSACKTSGQFSFEERMGCGFGACMGCSCETKYGNKRICKDGPVLEKEEIVW